MTNQPMPSLDAFLEDVRNGYGDNRTSNTGYEMTDNYWASRLAPAPAEYASQGGMYRQMLRDNAAPGAISEEWAAAYKGAGTNGDGTQIGAKLVEQNNAYQQNGWLAQYAVGKPQTSKWAQNGRSDSTYVNAVKTWLPHLGDMLPAEEYAEVLEQYNAADARLNGINDTTAAHQELRQQLVTRKSGTNVGIMGADPKVMATEYRARQQKDIDTRFGGRHDMELSAGTVSGISVNIMDRAANQEPSAVFVNRPHVI